MSATDFFPLKFNKVTVALNQNANKHSTRKNLLHNINLTITDKGITAIVGSNGAGKTLLLKCCANLMPINTGSIEWNIKPKPPVITFVPQQPILLDKTVRDNIILPLKHNNKALSDRDLKKRVDDALNWANIKALAPQPALTLSSGEQQLVALARAWALKPAILLLDEPSANLDPVRATQINDLILALSKTTKIILSSHNLSQLQQLANDVILLDNGSLLLHKDCQSFIQTSHYQDFIGSK